MSKESKEKEESLEEKSELFNDFDSLMGDVSIDSYELPEEEASRMLFYSPKATDGPEGKYFAVIKLIPDPKRPSRPIQRHLQVYAECPELGISQYITSKENFKKNSCPMQKRFFLLWGMKTTKPHYYELRKKVSTIDSYYCLALIVKDKQRPELEGQVVVFKFNKSINEIITGSMKPSKEALEVGTKALDPFGLFNSKNLILDLGVKTVTDEGKKFTDYSKVKFMDDYTPVSVWVKPGDKESKEVLEKNPRGRELMEVLYDNAPTLEDFAPKEWDSDLDRLVQEWMDFLPPTNKIPAGAKSESNILEDYSEEQTTKPKKKTVVQEDEEIEDELRNFLSADN